VSRGGGQTSGGQAQGNAVERLGLRSTYSQWPGASDDCETFRKPHLMSKRTIRIPDEGGLSGAGET